MSVVPLRKAVEAVAEIPAAEASPRAEARGRAKSVTRLPSELPGLPFPWGAPGDAVSRAGGAATGAGKRVAAVLSRPVIHLPAPAVSAVWAHHRAAASHWETWLVRWPRYAWGVLHTGVTAVVYGVLWATTSPAGFVVLVALAFACRAGL